jgi:Flp pilus assembly protein TadG
MKAIHNSLVRLRSFTKDCSGSVAVTVALASVVLFVVAGVAVDMARAYRARLVSGPATGRVSRCVGSARALGECLTRIGTM